MVVHKPAGVENCITKEKKKTKAENTRYYSSTLYMHLNLLIIQVSYTLDHHDNSTYNRR